MRISVMSDLHLEFESSPAIARNKHLTALTTGGLPRVEADLVILPGDIHTKGRGASWAASVFDVPVVMVGGNHESYGDSLFANIKKNRDNAASQGAFADGTPRVTYLEREVWTWTSPAGERIRVLGTTLWSSFGLFGDESRMKTQSHARGASNDYNRIRLLDRTFGYGEVRKYDPEDAARIHALAVGFLRDELAKAFDGITVVATHHAPSARSVPAAERNDPLSAAYATDLEPLMREFRPALWVHGHIHEPLDYRVGETRVVCNPRGYFASELVPGFEWGKVIQLP